MNGWHILLSNGNIIKNFEFKDEWCIRQQCFMEFNDWGVLIYKTPMVMFGCEVLL